MPAELELPLIVQARKIEGRLLRTGNRMVAIMAIMAITMSNSIRVKPFLA
jgi:hypothetical protein